MPIRDLELHRRSSVLLAVAVLALPACDDPEEDIVAARKGGAAVELLREAGAFATFGYTDPTGCIQTGAFLVTSASSEGSTPISDSEEAFLNLTLAQSDVCQDVTLIDGAGEISDATFEIAPDLGSAHVAGTVQLADFVHGHPIQFTIDVTWTGSGPMRPFGGVTHENFLGGLVVDRRLTRVRSAIATGTISDGTTNYAEQGSVEGENEIDAVVGGTVEVNFKH